MIPDYKNYSIEQLIDARDHVDKVTFPDRYELIINELASRNIPVKPVIKGTVKNLNTKKSETQFGLIVTRHRMMNLIVFKIAALLALSFFGIKFYEGVVLQEVTSGGNLLQLSDSPIGYSARMLLYGTFSLYSIWIISFGAKLKQENQEK